MALIDTALVTVKDALADVTEVASESLGTVSAEEKRSHKGRMFLLILVVLAVLGFIAWKKSSSSSESEADTVAA